MDLLVINYKFCILSSFVFIFVCGITVGKGMGIGLEYSLFFTYNLVFIGLKLPFSLFRLLGFGLFPSIKWYFSSDLIFILFYFIFLCFCH